MNICPNCGTNTYPTCCGQQEEPGQYPITTAAQYDKWAKIHRLPGFLKVSIDRSYYAGKV